MNFSYEELPSLKLSHIVILNLGLLCERRKTEDDYLNEFKGLEGFSKNTEEEDADTIYFKKVAHEDKARLLVASGQKRKGRGHGRP